MKPKEPPCDKCSVKKKDKRSKMCGACEELRAEKWWRVKLRSLERGGRISPAGFLRSGEKIQPLSSQRILRLFRGLCRGEARRLSKLLLRPRGLGRFNAGL